MVVVLGMMIAQEAIKVWSSMGTQINRLKKEMAGSFMERARAKWWKRQTLNGCGSRAGNGSWDA